MVSYSPHRAIYRHAQRNGTSCGRACAQMIISSMVQSPDGAAGGVVPSDTDPVPVGQDTLEGREPHGPDAPGSWSTHPDELLGLLQNAGELKGLAHHAPALWRIETFNSHAALVTDLILAMQRGMPSIVSINQWDHWAVVAELGVDGSTLDFIELYDPIPIRLNFAHTYRDACRFQSDGSLWNWELTGTEFGGYNLQIGPFPPPAGTKMQDYSGQYLAILHGARFTEPDRRKGRYLFKEPRRWKNDDPPAITPDLLVDELELRAQKWKIEDLSRLLLMKPQPAMHVVKDIEGSGRSYRLLSLFAPSAKLGVMAVFNLAGALLHFRFLNDSEPHQQLAVEKQSPLWWSRRYMPTLASPYFVFRREVKTDRVEYRRLYDGYTIDTPVR